MTPSIAVLGHRGWLGQRVVPALIQAGFTTRVIVRKGSQVGEVPDGVDVIVLDWADTLAFTEALKEVDVVMYAPFLFALVTGKHQLTRPAR
jgi:uncharacterized protein YbjT (DUF2867 family)